MTDESQIMDNKYNMFIEKVNKPNHLYAEIVELGDEINKALRKLPFQQRSAFTLRYLEGLSLEETAEAMNLSVGAVKANVWQAGEKMRRFLSHVAEEV